MRRAILITLAIVLACYLVADWVAGAAGSSLAELAGRL